MSQRLRSRLMWSSASKPVAAHALTARAVPIAEREQPILALPAAPRDQAIAFLHIGAEVEHALMAQYLYAAYSLDENQRDPRRRALVQKWRNTIAEIAREEMGHLATVQNVLTAIGGPICFDREDYPIQDPDLWPFPFQLEPLTKNSLGKYVLAEMPSEQVLQERHLTQEIDEIKKKVHAADDLTVHRVGLIYDAIKKLLTAGPMIQGPPVPPATDEHPYVATVDIQARSLNFQVTPAAWGLGYKQILIETAQDRQSAIDAIAAIAVQGEGSDVGKLSESHFGRFFDIYREFPDDNGDWRPSKKVATNPTTNPGVDDPSRQVEGDALPWATLSNLRYRMALMYLKHSFYVEAPAESPSNSPRGALVSWAFGEMYNIRSLANILMRMPLQPGSDLMAGPPFDMPYSLALPAQSDNRWRLHRDLLTASIQLTDRMLERATEHADYLRALRASDQRALEQVTALTGA